MEKSLLIVNPVSGKGKVKSYLMDILMELCAGGSGVTVCMTEKHGDADLFAARFGPEVDRIICTGGDGSLSEVISGLMTLPEEERPAIGYIPLGTTNDMASTLNIPKAPKDAISQMSAKMRHSSPRLIDVGQIGSDYFGYVAAFGTFTDVPFTTPQAAKNTWGYLAYLGEALGQLTEITTHHARITYDGGYIEDDLLFGFVTNSLSVAGIVKLSEDDVALDDGLFEVLLIKKPRNLTDLNESLTNILKKDFNTEHVTLLHTKKISFEFDEPIQWTRDGEDGGIYRSVDIVNHRRAVKIFV